MGTYDTIGGTPRHDPAADQGQDPSELEDAVLELLEDAGLATEDNDRIIAMISAAEHRSRICIDCDGAGVYPSGSTCVSCAGSGFVGKGDGAPSAFPMTANPDSALRQAEKALAEIIRVEEEENTGTNAAYYKARAAALRRAREAHALIIEALAQSQDKP